MPRLVDGDNLLGTWPGRTRSDAEKRQLAREVSRLAVQEGRRIVMVFDGPGPLGVSLGANVVFSGAGVTADQRILQILRAERDVRGWTIVTNDRSLADQCRWIGAQVESVRDFRARLARETGSEKPEGVHDLDYWMETFGEDD